MDKKIYKKLNIILFLIVLITGSFLGWKLFEKIKKELHIETIELKDTYWSDVGSFLTARIPNNTNNLPELHIYKTNDGQFENVEGTWNFSYSKPTELFIYGHFPQEPNTSRLFSLTELGSVQKNTSRLPGPVTGVSQNPKGTYMMITGVNKENSYYSCIGEKLIPEPYPCLKILGDILKESDYDKTLMYQSFWNLENERELIILEKGGQNRIWSFDPWEDKPVLVTNTADKVIQATAENSISKYLTKSYLGGRILSVQTSETKHKWFFIPKGSEVKWLNKDHFAIVEPDKKIFIYNVNKRTRALLVDLPDNAENITTYYSPEK